MIREAWNDDKTAPRKETHMSAKIFNASTSANVQDLIQLIEESFVQTKPDHDDRPAPAIDAISAEHQNRPLRYIEPDWNKEISIGGTDDQTVPWTDLTSPHQNN